MIRCSQALAAGILLTLGGCGGNPPVPIEDLPVEYSNTNAIKGKGRCGIPNPVKLAVVGEGMRLTPPALIDPALALNMVGWERDLQLMALTEFGVPLAGAGRVSGYSCRNVYGKTSGKLSRHANGLAIDVPVFRLSDGREIEVRKFWRTATPEGRFLAAAHVSACRWFNTVLGPDYNSAHRDHFHVDIGPTGICK